jgi:3'-5' exoribonuclease
LWRTLGEYVASFKNPYLKTLLGAFMADAEIVQAYKTAPAAKGLHHAFIGGLLEHVVSLLNSCELVCKNYPHLDRDLLLTGAFLHDIGKVHELSYGRAFSYTTRGQLLGHMIIELEMLQGKVEIANRALGKPFPEDLKTLIEHMIISHHGQYEFGSPKLPMFPEALVLHYLDDLDSKIEAMRAHFERHPGQDWTDYNGSLGRTLLNSRRILERIDKPEPEAAAGAAAE